MLFTISLNTFSQGWIPQGARSSALANSSVTLVDLFAYHHNPGALGQLESGGAAVHYETRFLLRELQTQSFVLAQPLKTGVMSLGGQFYGYETFRTNRIGLGYSLLLADNFSAGVQVNYMSLRLDPQYGVKHTVSGEFGMLTAVGEDITLGASVVNLGRNRLSEFQDDRFSTILRLGMSYKIMEDLLLLTEIEQEVTYSTRLRTGAEYSFKDVFFLRIGAQTAPVELSFGFGGKFGRTQLDLGSQYNQVLGWTPSASFIFNFEKVSE